MLIRGVIVYLWQRKAHLHSLNLSLQGLFLADVIEVRRTWKGRKEKKKVSFILSRMHSSFFSLWCKPIRRPNGVT